MGIAERIEEIRASEHLRLRTALVRMGSRIAEVEHKAAAHRAAPKKVDTWGDPIAGQVSSGPSRAEAELPGLKRAYLLFEDLVLERLNLWEERLWPLVRDWARGVPIEQAVLLQTTDLVALRSRIDEPLSDLRRRVFFVGELGEPLKVVLASLELCDRAESEVMPGLTSGHRELADRVERSLTSDDIARNLRMVTYDDDDDDEPRRTPLKKLLDFLGVR